jgi:hypothetical protein
MPDDPWAEFRVGPAAGAAPSAPPAAARPPAFIPGVPKAAPAPTAFQVEDQQIQREAAARAAVKDRQAIQSNEMDLAGGIAAKAAETERNNAAFLIRAMGANNDYETTGLGARSYPGELVHEYAPGLLNQLPGVIGNSPERQAADKAQLEFISAILRSDSGAAIPPEEIAQAQKLYFPQPGDSDEAVAQARNARLRAIAGLGEKSGRLEGSAGERYASIVQELDGGAGAQPPGTQVSDLRKAITHTWTMADTVKTWGEPIYGDDGSPLGPDGGFSYDAQGNFLGMAVPVTGHDERPTSFKQGFGEGAAHTILNAGSYAGWLNPADALAQSVNILSGANLPTLQNDAAQGQRALDSLSERSPYRGSAAGKFTGALVASLPTMAIPNPMAGGAVAGALMADNPNNPVDVGVNAAAGAAFGKAGEFAAGKLFNRATGKVLSPEQQAVLEASDNLEAATGVKVPVRQPDLRPETRGKVGVVEKSESGGPIIRNAYAEDNAAMEAALGKIGGDRAAPDRFTAGSMAQDALDRTAKNASERGGTLYRRAERLAGNVEVRPTNAIAEIDSQIADLIEKGERSNGGLISYLNDLKADLTRGGPVPTGVLDANGKMVSRPPKGLSIDTVRSLRTDARGQINARNLGLTDAERRVSMVVAAANKDIEAALANNPKALGAFQNADRFWQEKKAFEKQISDRLLGPNNNRYGPEKTATALESMMKPGGDFKRFQRWHATLDPEEKLDWAARTVENLGRNGKGEFDPGLFLRNVGDKGILSPKAARLILGEDGMKSLENIKVIATAKVAAMSERNTSGTSGAVNRVGSGLRTFFLSLLGLASGDATGMIVGGGIGHFWEKLGSQRSARLLINPDFTKWVRTLPESASPEVINKSFKRLELVAERSPVLAMDVLALQNSLREAFTQSPAKLAAEPSVGQQENNGGGIPPQ